MVGPVGGGQGPAPEDKENGAFLPFFSFWQVLFGRLRGTGNPVRGRQGGRVTGPVSRCLGSAPGDGEGCAFFPFFLASVFWRPWRDGDPNAREAGWQDRWAGAWDQRLRTKKIMCFFLFLFFSVSSFIVAVVVLVWRVLFGSLKGAGQDT